MEKFPDIAVLVDQLVAVFHGQNGIGIAAVIRLRQIAAVLLLGKEDRGAFFGKLRGTGNALNILT
jgi:hypothetical protein